MVGHHQAQNAILALAAAGKLWETDRRIDAGAAIDGLGATLIPLRLQVAGEQPLVILDAAHSPDRARALANTLREVYFAEKREGPIVFVLGCSGGHSPAEVVGILAPLANRVIATKSRHPAAIPAHDVASPCGGTPAEVLEPVSAAVDRAMELAGENGAIVVTGSLFVAAEALGHLQDAK